jgi:hypothetical protein
MRVDRSRKRGTHANGWHSRTVVGAFSFALTLTTRADYIREDELATPKL